MKCAHSGLPKRTGLQQLLVHFLLTFPLINATPFQHNQGNNAYSDQEPRQRNKNWCAYVVHKNVSCAAVGGTESFVQPEVLPCPTQQPNCAQQVTHRTRFRPMYRIAYKTVTELEYRCCPGYQGHDCRELKNPPAPRYTEQHWSNTLPAASGHIPGTPGPDQQTWVRKNHPWGGGGGGAGPAAGQTGGHRAAPQPGLAGHGRGHTVRHLEEEVQRLAQMVLHTQATVTDMSSNLRLSLQEDASRMLDTLLSNLRQQPASVRSGETQVVPLLDLQAFRHDYTSMDEVMNKITQVTDNLETKSHALDYLSGRVTQHDEQLRLLVEAAQSPPATAAPPATAVTDDGGAGLRAYVDEKIRALRDELMEGMEIKMGDMKGVCDYKIMALREQCEGQETNYLSLAELMDSKEADLRKEILDLKTKVADSAKAAAELSAANLQTSDPLLLPRVEDLEARLNLSERNAETRRLVLEKKLREEASEGDANLGKALELRMTSVDDRVTALLVDMSANLTAGVQAEDMEALRNEVNSHNGTIQDLEDRLNALDQLCSEECRSKSTVIENIQRDLESSRTAMGAIQAGLDGYSESLGAMEELVQGLNFNSSIQEVQSELEALGQRVEVTEVSLLDTGHYLGRQSQRLQDLNATCRQVDSRAAQVAKDLLELHAAHRQELSDRLGELSGEVRSEADRCREKTRDVEREVAAVGGRVASVEGVCGKLEPISRSLERIKEGLNKHVSGLWTCVGRLNGTLRAHAQDIGGLKATCRNLRDDISGVARDLKDLTTGTASQTGVIKVSAEDSGRPALPKPDPLPQSPVGPLGASPSEPHVMEAGEAGPPGTMTSSTLPRGTDGSMPPVQGFAGAPAPPPVSVQLRLPGSSDAVLPQRPSSQKPVMNSGERVSFSAGLDVLPFTGEVGIIRFNKVLVNDGGHYDPHTGIFTAPVDGRYLLSAVLTAQRGERVEAVLSVSNRSIQRLDTAGFLSGIERGAETIADERCDCGATASLSLVLALKRGDRAGLVMTAGKLAISGSSETLSTFSSVLLYASPAKR